MKPGVTEFEFAQAEDWSTRETGVAVPNSLPGLSSADAVIQSGSNPYATRARPSFVQVAASGPTFDGYWWENSGALKVVILGGFVQGYIHGRLKGVMDGARVVGPTKFKDLACANPESVECNKWNVTSIT